MSQPEEEESPTYTVKDDDRVLAEHVTAEEVVDVMAEAGGHASIFDDEDGTLVVADTDGNLATIAALEERLYDYEVAKDATKARDAARPRPYRLRARLVGDDEGWTMIRLGGCEAIEFEGEVRDEGEAPVDGPDDGRIWSEVFAVTAPSLAAARALLIEQISGSREVSLAGADPEAAITHEIADDPDAGSRREGV